MIRRRGDVVLAGVAGLLALGYLAAAQWIEIPQLPDPVGPRAFPMLIGGGLLISACMLLLETRSRTDDAPVIAEAPPRFGGTVLAALVWTVIYYLAFEPAGYLLATPVYCFGLLCVLNRGRHVMNVVTALLMTGVLYGLFVHLLGVPLPSGPLPS